MMDQYLEIKSNYSEALVFYRMGDFYELFFEDAKTASSELQITLTTRGKHLDQSIPMCGVPFHAAEGYINTLIHKGYKVAVCEQTESPSEAKKRGYKSIVKREVVRLITPGTITEDSLLVSNNSNFLISLNELRNETTASWVDISTGDFFVKGLKIDDISSLFARLKPKEVLISEGLLEKVHTFINTDNLVITPLTSSSYNSMNAEKKLLEQFQVKSLDGFGEFTKPMIGAMGSIIDYLQITQIGKSVVLNSPILETHSTIMEIDPATRRNLEITKSLSGDIKGSLLDCLDKTITSNGKRLLESRLSAPLTNINNINERLDAVEFFLENESTTTKVRELLKKCPDFGRALSRLALHRGTSQDLISVKNGLIVSRELALEVFSENSQTPPLVQRIVDNISAFKTLIDLLESSLTEKPVVIADKVSNIAEGYNVQLDKYRRILSDSGDIIIKMQLALAEETKIPSLKIRHNNVLGYFIDLTIKNAEKLSETYLSEKFIHRQTTANSKRFTSHHLSEIERDIRSADMKSSELENSIFYEIKSSVVANASTINAAAKSLAELDFFASLAEVSKCENWIRPVLSNGTTFEVINGRHPIVESSLKSKSNNSFISNNCELKETEKRILLLTGPNMAGKSTYLRQNAIIALLSQVGSFVPAEKAHIGVIDRIFSRIGAADDLAHGHSTFMMEMIETATILNQASEKSFVILDEIGRGTATYDGLSLAWSILEYLHDKNNCRSLFATHYHELTSLEKTLKHLCNFSIDVKEFEGELIFLHKVTEGSAKSSYGIQVAKLAGLPSIVTDSAAKILSKLEENSKQKEAFTSLDKDEKGPEYIHYAPKPEIEYKSSTIINNTVLKSLENKNLDEISPLEALEILYEIKKMWLPL